MKGRFGKMKGEQLTKPKKVTDKEAKMIAMRLNGETYEAIGKAFGRTPLSAWRTLHRESIKDKFEDYLKDYLALTLTASLKKSAELVNADIAGPDGVESIDLYKMQMAEIDKVLKTAGLRPSDSTSVFIQNLTQVNSFENPLVKSMIDNHLKNLVEYKPDDAVDAEEVG